MEAVDPFTGQTIGNRDVLGDEHFEWPSTLPYFVRKYSLGVGPDFFRYLFGENPTEELDIVLELWDDVR